MKSVYDIKSEFFAIQELLENEEFDKDTGELIDNSKELQQLLNEVESDKANKADNIAYLVKQANDSQVAIKSEIDRLKARSDMFKRQEEKLMTLLDFLLGKEKLKTDKFTFSYRKSTSVNIIDVKLIPKEYLRTTTTVETSPDKKKIKASIVDSHSVAGTELITKNTLGVK